MITIIRDNTMDTYYTICKKCNSEFAYNYPDVEFEGDIFITNRTVKCPVCKFKTSAELKCKNEYTKTDFIPYIPTLLNSCCRGNKNE